MEVILLERVSRLGQMGDTVRVKDGFARNFLLPQGKALRANEANKKKFEGQRSQLEARNLERRSEAQTIADTLDGKNFTVVRSAGETGQLYGSVTTRDISDLLTAEGYTVSRNQVELNQPIKTIGLTNVAIALHPEVEVTKRRSTCAAVRAPLVVMSTTRSLALAIDAPVLLVIRRRSRRIPFVLSKLRFGDDPTAADVSTRVTARPAPPCGRTGLRCSPGVPKIGWTPLIVAVWGATRTKSLALLFVSIGFPLA